MPQLRSLTLIVFFVALAGSGSRAWTQFLILAQDEDSVQQLTSGSALTLDSEGVGAAVGTNLSIRFEGPESSTATILEPELTGSVTFAISSQAELPLFLTSGRSGDLRLNFTPSGPGPFSARLTLKLRQNDLGRPVRTSDILINLTGRSADYSVAFLLPGGNETVLPADGLLAFPDTAAGSSTSATLIVTNRGSGPGTLASVALDADEAFAVSGLQLLPAVIEPGRDLRFSGVFTPPETATFGGSLSIVFGAGSRSVRLTGSEASVALQYQAAGDLVAPGGTVAFGLEDLGEDNAIRFEVSNNGTTEKVIVSISIKGDTFDLVDLPVLPLTLGSGQAAAFGLTFNPADPGTFAGELQISSATFPLSGAVPELPPVTIADGDRIVSPAQQLPVSVSLAGPYPVDLVGDLALTFDSEAFSGDPSIQFASGGRTVPFVIAANETRARFPSGAREILVQTGTVAGQITIDAVFETDRTAIDITPATLPAAVLTVPSGAPILREMQATSISDSSITLQVTGFTTARSVTALDFQFIASPGSNLQTTSLQTDVENPFQTWYQTSLSSSFGSQFTATVNLDVSGDVNAIQGVSVSAGNALGTSERVSVTLQ